MALIRCPECRREVSDKAASCPHCGAPIAAKKEDVMIRFPVSQGQLLNNKCYVYNKKTKKVIVSGKQGETVSFACEKPIDIYVVVKGSFGKPEVTAKPGDRFDVGYRAFGKIYLSKVDEISGKPNSFELDRFVNVYNVFKKK